MALQCTMDKVHNLFKSLSQDAVSFVVSDIPAGLDRETTMRTSLCQHRDFGADIQTKPANPIPDLLQDCRTVAHLLCRCTYMFPGDITTRYISTTRCYAARSLKVADTPRVTLPYYRHEQARTEHVFFRTGYCSGNWGFSYENK